MLSWDTVQAEFTWEGSWRDIYVRSTELSDWQRVVRSILDSGMRSTFSVNGEYASFPTEAAEVLAQGRQAAVVWSIFVNEIMVNCHFFDVSEIEFDLDPREVADQASFDAVIEFMKMVASSTGKHAVMTPENTPEEPIITVDPFGGVEYRSTAGFFTELAQSRV